MKKTILILFVAGSVIGLFTEHCLAIQENEITVMTYNIRIGVGMVKPGTPPAKLKKSPKILDEIVAAIKSVNPDVVGLQEVYGKKMAKKLSKMLGMEYSYRRHGDNEHAAWWGVAILSKHKILKTKGYSVFYGGDKPYRARALLMSTIDFNGKKITFYNTHYQDKDGALKKEPKNTMKRIAKSKNPVILMGDLNMVPDDPLFKPITDKLKDSCEAVNNENSAFVKTNGTFQSPNNPKYDHWRIDYIFYDPESSQVLDVGLLDKEHWNASDHIGYFSRIKLK